MGSLLARALVFTIALGSCLGKDEELPPDRPLPHPLESLSFHSKEEIFVRVSPGVSLSELCDFSVFTGLQPGTTADEAIHRLGTPRKIYRERGQLDTVYSFPTQEGTLEIIKQFVSSEGFAGYRWLLRIRPSNKEPKDLCKAALPEIANHVPQTSRIIITGPQESAEVELVNGKVQKFWWLG